MNKSNHQPFLTVLLFVLLSAVVQAQTNSGKGPAVYRISVKEAVEVAFKNGTDLKNSRSDVTLQQLKNKEITGAAYPQLSGSFQLNHFVNIPVTVLPDFISPSLYGVLVDKGVRDGNGNAITAPTSYNTVAAQFGVPWTASGNITLQQLLFQADVFIGLKARKTAMDYANQNVKVTEDKLRENVYKSYYVVLIGEKRKGIVQSAVKRVEKLLNDVNVMYKNGFVEKLDIDRTQVSLNNLKATENQMNNLIALGYASLKFNLGIAQSDSLQLTDTLSENDLKNSILTDGSFKYEDRSEIRLLNAVTRLQQLDLKRNKLAYAPTVAAFASHTSNAQRLNFDFFENRRWFPSTILGVSVNIPIFDGMQRESRIKAARINLEKTQTTLQGVKNAIDFEQRAATEQLTNSLLSMEIQKRNMELALRVYEVTKKKYEQGIGSNFELLQAEGDLEEAEGNYYQSLYEAIIAKVSYLKSTGKL